MSETTEQRFIVFQHEGKVGLRFAADHERLTFDPPEAYEAAAALWKHAGATGPVDVPSTAGTTINPIKIPQLITATPTEVKTPSDNVAVTEFRGWVLVIFNRPLAMIAWDRQTARDVARAIHEMADRARIRMGA